MKVVVCGSRGWRDIQRIRNFLRTLPPDTLVITGGAKGADRIANEEALYIGLATKVIKPDWEAYGKKAGFMRNLEMLDEQPQLVVAFWDGASNGTKHTIDNALKRKINLYVYIEEE